MKVISPYDKEVQSNWNRQHSGNRTPFSPNLLFYNQMSKAAGSSILSHL